jgi:hypothetical protein
MALTMSIGGSPQQSSSTQILNNLTSIKSTSGVNLTDPNSYDKKLEDQLKNIFWANQHKHELDKITRNLDRVGHDVN